MNLKHFVIGMGALLLIAVCVYFPKAQAQVKEPTYIQLTIKQCGQLGKQVTSVVTDKSELIRTTVHNEVIYGYDHGPFIVNPKLHIIEEEGTGQILVVNSRDIERKFTS